VREDIRPRFPFSGIVFEEYNATVTLSTGATECWFPPVRASCSPLGTMDTFVTYGAPANRIETVNTMGPIMCSADCPPGRQRHCVNTDASPLPVSNRPRLAVKIHTSN
jgi:hypothetical protein